MVSYYAIFEHDRKDGGFVVRFPDFGYGATQGEDIEESREMAQDLLRCLIQEAIDHSRPLPAVTRRKGKQYQPIALPALQSAKAELYTAFRRSGITKAEFARRIGIAKTNVERLFDLKHASRLNQIEDAFRALGKRLDLSVRNAA